MILVLMLKYLKVTVDLSKILFKYTDCDTNESFE